MTMFKRKLLDVPVYNNKSLTLRGEELQYWQGYKDVMSTIRQLVSAEDYYFDLLYRNSVLKLMEFCQTQPKTQKGKYAVEGGLFYYIIERIITGLKIRQGYLLPKGCDAETAARQEPIWTYMIFSIHLLMHSANIILEGNRVIRLFKKSGGSISIWHYLAGSLFEPETCYKVYFEPRKTIFIREQVISALIGHWVPGQALRWLKSEEYEEQWWKVLFKQADPCNELVENLQKVEQQIASCSEKIELRVAISKVDDPLEIIYANFVELIKSKLSDKSLMVNDERGCIYRVPEGILIVLNKYLELFLNHYPQYRKQFNFPHPFTDTAIQQFVSRLQGVSQWIAINKKILHEYELPISGKTCYLKGVLLPLSHFYDNQNQYPHMFKEAKLDNTGV